MTKQEIIDYMYKNHVQGDFKIEEMAEDLAQPEINREPHWIPCSEDLPKKENDFQRRGYYLTTNAYGTVGVTKYEFDGDFGFVGWGGNRPSDIRIIAWMPLPEPYGGDNK